VRPIAIGEVWVRLASLCAMAACQDAGLALAPLQLGVGVPGGSQSVGHALRSGLSCCPGDVTLQLDFRNLYNSVSRTALLQAVASSKRRAYRQVFSALPFVPMSVESFGRLGAPALTLLGDLADQAVQAGGPGLSRAAFISGALRERSVALCRGNASLCRSGAYVAMRAAGRAPMRGLAQPSAEVV
jgi:hypothetical protein